MNFIPISEQERDKMLEVIGKGIQELFSAIPDDLQLKTPLNLPLPLSELEVKREVQKLEKNNRELIHFAGGGIYDHYIPSVLKHITGRPEFYTAYTPYQPEVSQGTLQAMFEYQSMMSDLTGMEVANASIYDGATALSEAVCMAIAVKKRKKVVLSEGINPHYLRVIKTYLRGSYPIEMIPLRGGFSEIDTKKIDEETACVVIQHPNYLGSLEEVSSFVEKAKSVGALSILSFDPISLAILKTPGEFDVDIATAEGQSLGIPMSLGGAHLGIFTTKRKFIRKMPGRLAGQTVDDEGRVGYVMVLQTREQHIRRERATSNICTNQQLCALSAALYLAVMGCEGLKEVANQTTQKAHYLAKQLKSANFKLPYTKNNKRFFREFVVRIPYGAKRAIDSGLKKGYLSGIDLGKFKKEWENNLLISVTEKRTKAEIDNLVEILSKAG